MSNRLGDRLKKRHSELGSWRAVAREYNDPVIKPGTLSRIAKGGYTPKNKKILRALGMVRRTRLFDMPPSELLWRLENREEMD